MIPERHRQPGDPAFCSDRLSGPGYNTRERTLTWTRWSHVDGQDRSSSLPGQLKSGASVQERRAPCAEGAPRAQGGLGLRTLSCTRARLGPLRLDQGSFWAAVDWTVSRPGRCSHLNWLERRHWKSHTSKQDDSKEIKPVSPKGNQPRILAGRTDAKTEAPGLGHLLQRADSLEKTLMLGKIEGRRRRGQQRMRWLDGITDSTDIV